MTTRFEPRLDRAGNGPYRLLRGAQDRLVRRFLSALDDPRAAQQARLRHILSNAGDTAFGRAHDLSRVRTLEDLRAAVPVRSHAELSPWLDRVAAGEQAVLTRERVQMLLETSGTSGKPKHLPVTHSWAQSVADAQALWVLGLVRDHEGVARGRALTVVSPAEHARSPGGLAIGSNTGRMHQRQPWWLRLRYPVPYAAFCLQPAAVRQYAILRFALQAPVSTITTANPSTILLLCRRLQEWREPLSRDLADGTLRHGPAAAIAPADRRRLERRLRKRPVPTQWSFAKIWDLATVNCWLGGPAAYFVDRLPDALGAAVPVREVGITASEGFFAIPLGAGWGGGVLWTLGHVLEFIAEDGTPLWAWELEEGQRVRLVITTEAGLYRYDLQDTLEVIGRCGGTPVVRFVGKSGRFLNATGEKVSEGQVSEAVRCAARERGLQPVGFTARIVWGEIPYFELAAELPDGDATGLADAFDRHLRVGNLEYDSKRGSDRIGPARGRRLASGTYLRFREARVAAGASDGQVKDPLVALNDTEWGRLESAEGAPR